MQGGFDMKLKYISGIVLTSVLLVACGNSDESKEDKDEATGGNKGQLHIKTSLHSLIIKFPKYKLENNAKIYFSYSTTKTYKTRFSTK